MPLVVSRAHVSFHVMLKVNCFAEFRSLGSHLKEVSAVAFGETSGKS